MRCRYDLNLEGLILTDEVFKNSRYLEVLLILDIMFINGEGVRWSLAWVDPSVPALK